MFYVVVNVCPIGVSHKRASFVSQSGEYVN